jgi:hypothetical protein
MTRGRTPTKIDEGGVEGASDFERAFSYALIIYAVVEFAALALVVYYKLSR